MNNIDQPEAAMPQRRDTKTDALSAIGYILGVSYPVLALSTGVRAVYQYFVRDDIALLSVSLSGLAALCYLVATIGFFARRRWAWYVSVGSLGFETLMTLIVGTLSIINPELIGSTVWRYFGQDYGFFPLVQPLLGLVWLMWPQTQRAYGVRHDGTA
jgi:hypothetical protein